MTAALRRLALLAPIALLGLLGPEGAAALTVGGDPRVDPADFEITAFASGLPYPTSAQALSDGSLLVLVNPGGSLFSGSSGALLRLVDADADGVADGPGTTLASGLPGIATSLRLAGPLVLVSSRAIADEQISVLRLGATPADPIVLLGAIDLAFPPPGALQNHRNVALAVWPVPGLPGQFDVVFNVGSEGNDVATVATFDAGGIFAGKPGTTGLSMDGVYRFRLDASGGGVAVSALEKIATGLRNAAGLVFDPATGDLYLSENGMDGASESADELNRIAAADLGGAIEDFGFPTGFVDYPSGPAVGGGVQPIAAFLPLPVSGAASQGAVEVAFPPAAFPPDLRDGLLIGFHGSFSAAGPGNPENPIVYYDRSSGEYFHLIDVMQPVGHPNGLLATRDALYVVDLTTTGNPFSVGATGAIWRIRSLAPAPALPGAALAALGFLLVTLAARFARPHERRKHGA